jgi:hypothetical protein
MEEEECIICLENIDRTLGNYRIDLCDRCKYIIHIDCWEKYIKYRGNSYCIVCNKILNDDRIVNNNNGRIVNNNNGRIGESDQRIVNNNGRIVDNNNGQMVAFSIYRKKDLLITICLMFLFIGIIFIIIKVL